MVKTRLSLPALTLLLWLGACSFDPLGFLFSVSTPNERFDESRALDQPAALSLPGAFSFTVFSDLHIRDGRHANYEGLRARLGSADFSLFVGDLADNGQRIDFELFSRVMNEPGIPFYPAIGNHDVYSGGWPNARELLGPSSYAVQLNDTALLIVLDSANGTLGRSQYAWLVDLLGAADEDLIIVATHMQLFVNHLFETQQWTFPEEMTLLMNLFERSGVDAVFSGHSHRFDYRRVNGVDYYVSGAFRDGSTSAAGYRAVYDGSDLVVERFQP